MPQRPHLQPLPAPAQDEPSDDALMLRAAAGAEQAFVALVRRHEPRLRRFCSLLLKDNSLARDAAQEVFLKLWERRARFRAEGRFKELLFTIARNQCHSAGRARLVRSVLGLELRAHVQSTAQRPLASEELAQREAEALLHAALARLPEKFRLPLMLRFMEGMPYGEIARVIGRTESAARSRIFYGLEQLAALLPPEVCP